MTNTHERATDLLKLVRTLRAKRVSVLKEKGNISADDWSKVDKLARIMTQELINTYTEHLRLLMEALIEAQVAPSPKVQRQMLALNIEATVSGSLLLAHHDVLEERGRDVKDADKHLDRMLRAAEIDQNIAVTMILDSEEDPS
jgi:hypothetical protein